MGRRALLLPSWASGASGKFGSSLVANRVGSLAAALWSCWVVCSNKIRGVPRDVPPARPKAAPGWHGTQLAPGQSLWSRHCAGVYSPSVQRGIFLFLAVLTEMLLQEASGSCCGCCVTSSAAEPSPAEA